MFDFNSQMVFVCFFLYDFQKFFVLHILTNYWTYYSGIIRCEAAAGSDAAWCNTQNKRTSTVIKCFSGRKKIFKLDNCDFFPYNPACFHEAEYSQHMQGL